MSLDADVMVSLGRLRLDCALSAGDAGVVAILGPNGAGKTTLLRVLAGLVRPQRGRVVLDGVVLDDVAGGVHVLAERRPAALVFQDHLLLPHLTALDNVAFGLRCRGAGRVAARRTAMEWLERVGAAAGAQSRPGALSGGERQRVAVARAMATRPRLLLLDEPLAAVDAAARVDLRRVLRRDVDEGGGVRLLVTHDAVEAMALADRVVVLEGGRVVQEGDAVEVVARPRSPWVAAMVGLNLYRGVAAAGTLRLEGGAGIAATGDVTGPALAAISPRAVSLHRTRPEGSPRNCWAGIAVEVEPLEGRVRVRVAGELQIVAEVTPAAVAELRLAEGGPVFASVKATEVTLYPA